MSTSAGLPYDKVLNVEDFAHPALTPFLQEMQPGSDVADPSSAAAHRKYWEVAMAARAMQDAGVVHRDAEVLGIGAGSEPTIFWLTNRVRRVYATDLYLEPGVWREYANEAMLANPGRYWAGAWNRRRLVVQHMDARELRYEDESFDAVFSSSSLEHFGSLGDIQTALAEVERVLRPGGLFSLSTEYRLEGTWPGVEGCFIFDHDDLEREIIRPYGWELVDSLDTTVSPSTLATARLQADELADYRRLFDRLGDMVLHELTSSAPSLVVRLDAFLFTSVHLALRKE